MINSPLLFRFAFLLIFLARSACADGTIELVVRSPKTIIIESTVCVTFECQAPEDTSMPRKVTGGSELRFQTGIYDGEAREQIDVFLKVIDPESMKILALQHLRPYTDATWNPIILQTNEHFNVTIEMTNTCRPDFYGKRCGQFCVPSKNRHWECSSDGRRKCAVGWTRADCSIPLCSGGCSGHGRCVAPDQCKCAFGFNGTQCEQCIPSPGCVNGACHNNIPMTCACKPGFFGNKCNFDVNICNREKPCMNRGICSLDSSSGFRCDCPSGFFGSRCEAPLSKVRCADNADHVCQNGGTCISMNKTDIQCKCQPGFTGRFCEIGLNNDCSTKKCSNGATCQMLGDTPICVGTTTPVPRFNAKTHVAEKNFKVEEKIQTDVALPFWVYGFLFFCCIVGLLIATVYMYTRLTKTSPTDCSPLPTTMPMTQIKSPAYKVCIIDAETGLSSSGCSHSPPPAYSSPVIPRLYKSIPTHDEHSFRN